MWLYEFRTTSQNYVGSKQRYRLIRMNNFALLGKAKHNSKNTNTAVVIFRTVNVTAKVTRSQS
jgi:hypothetical protein